MCVGSESDYLRLICWKLEDGEEGEDDDVIDLADGEEKNDAIGLSDDDDDEDYAIDLIDGDEEDEAIDLTFDWWELDNHLLTCRKWNIAAISMLVHTVCI